MTKQQLILLLQQYGIQLDCFGQKNAKSLDHLLTEIGDGETILAEQDGRLVRKVSVLGVDVFANINDSAQHLIEDRQVFVDGRVRRRQMPTSISEKLHQSEDVYDAVARALEEEIGVRKFTLLTTTPKTRVEVEDSPSYPGILSEYTKYEVEILLDSSEYCSDGYREVQKDKTTHFVWEKGG
jgi:hypothetical protein